MGQNQFALFLEKFRNNIYSNFLGGPLIMPMRYVINFYKCLTFFWILLLMWYYQNYSTGMYLYLFLHGSYGFLWCLKQVYFPDASFKVRSTFGSLLLLSIVLFFYWCIPLTIAMGIGIQEPSATRIFICLFLYIAGAILMIGSDRQKTLTLQKRKRLISTGFFAKTRNPNYLGETMIYGSFALASGHWVSYLIVMSVWATLFAMNMYLKDQLSYKKKQGWDQYKQRSYIFLPKIFPYHILNIILYGGIATALYIAIKQDRANQIQWNMSI